MATYMSSSLHWQGILGEKLVGGGQKRFRIDNSKREKHTALIDCDLLSKVYINLIDQKEPTLNLYDKENNKDHLDFKNGNMYYKKIVEPSSDEIKLHKEFLKNSLKKNFFSN